MRILRHLSFSNLIAVLALFIALGGAAYAGSKINGSEIASGSIGGGKLRNGTITAKKIRKGTITGAQIKKGSIEASSLDLSTLGTVPSAQNAASAQTAQIANTAQSAQTAEMATTAQTAINATRAAEADTARQAAEAATARHADEAATATTATTAAHATDADRASVAGEAEALGGRSAEELTVGCAGETERYGGMCWDQTTRPARAWLVAVAVCGNAGGRLPTIGELIAFVLRPGEQVEGQVWSSDLSEVAGGKETVLTSDEKGRDNEGAGGALGYRCVFPLTN